MELHFMLWALLWCAPVLASDHDEEAANHFIHKVDEELRKKSAISAFAQWNYETNITEENSKKKIDAALDQSKYIHKKWSKIKKYPWKTYKNEILRRMFESYSFLGSQALDDDDQSKMQNIITAMQNTYSTAKICDYFNKSKCDLTLSPDITNIMASSRNSEELKHTWLEWYKASGKPSKEHFKQYVVLMNKAARLNNLANAEELWLYEFHDKKFKKKCHRLLDALGPLYKDLHAYVRFKLRNLYGDKIVSKKGPIPEYLMGNMWAQTWENLLSIVLPYPEAESINITQTMLEQNYTPLKMFQTAEEFFTSLNMSSMLPKFWENSLIEKPVGREVVCHASAWDFSTGDDFRIKMCTQVNQEDFFVIHHEMGHTEYQMLYSHQPYIFQDGANSGFHEAVGDAIALSVTTAKHLKKIGLYSGSPIPDKKARINQLMAVALKKIAFIPFGYLLDQWRWEIFNGRTDEDEYNCRYWELKIKYQGVAPPEPRSEEFFDPAGKYHVSADVSYLRYFVSHILQFQFHEAMCKKANEYVPGDPEKALNLCDIYQSKKAGNAFRSMLELGASKPWPDALELLTGTREMEIEPLLAYFDELHKWLKEENERTGAFIGWHVPKTFKCPKEKHDD